MSWLGLPTISNGTRNCWAGRLGAKEEGTLFVVEGATYTSILKTCVTSLLASGKEAAPRGQPTCEIQCATMVLSNPRARFPRLKGRNANIFALFAETLWVLAGRNDLSFIQAYLPRMAAFSEDGNSLSGGYGPRIRNWKGVDQLKSVASTLRHDANSRRATISLFDPARDHEQTQKDIPCTSVLQFTNNSGALDLTVYSRSMDILWGSAINFFEWTIFQEAVALWLNMPLGMYNHVAGSLHIYGEYFARGRRFAQEPEPSALPVTSFDIALDVLDASCEDYFRIESLYRGGLCKSSLVSNSAWLFEAAELSRAFWLAKNTRDFDAARTVVGGLPSTEATAMASEQIDFMERSDAKNTGRRPPDP